MADPDGVHQHKSPRRRATSLFGEESCYFTVQQALVKLHKHQHRQEFLLHEYYRAAVSIASIEYSWPGGFSPALHGDEAVLNLATTCCKGNAAPCMWSSP
eukprot:SAG31_NODE_486_length_15001_cov_8.454405_14_plen_100_part_00